MEQFAIEAYRQVLEIALPIGLIFEICNLIVCTIMRVAFGGKLWLKG